MAPSPEYDKEPKAPDKSASSISSEDSKLLNNLVTEQPNPAHKTTNSASNSELENNKHVETLDDDKLRALLNEALTYKCPKDREGKSSLFKELLEEVEADEAQACEAAARSLAGWGRAHSNSLQELVAALAAEPAPRRPRPPPHSVAARARHGGSLPSGVDTSSLGEEGRAGYLATVRCVNPPPLNERRVSTSDANAPHELDLINRRKPFPMTYTARATLEIGSGAVCSGRALTTTTQSNQMGDESSAVELEEIVCHRAEDTGFSAYVAGQHKLIRVLGSDSAKTECKKAKKCERPPETRARDVDSAISFSCITTPEVVNSCNTTTSTTHAPTVETKQSEAPRVASLPPAPAPPPADPAQPAPEEQARGATSALPLSRPSAPLDDCKVPTHTIVPLLPSFVKSLDENGNSVQGYGSPPSAAQHKKPRRKKSSKNETVIDCQQLDGYRGDEDVNELLRFIESDRAPKLRKHRDDDDHKANKKRAAERRKRHKPARASSLDELSRGGGASERAAAAPPPRRSWGDAAPPPPPEPEPADFQTVTKKRRPRRRPEETGPRPAAPRPPASAPASDRSNDSNDDLDSVHSLPAAPPPPPPHASYADIARTRHNIPDLIESCNYYAEGEREVRRGAPAETYPALETRAEPPRRPRDKAPVTRRAPDVVSDRRPPVILLDCMAQARELDGVTFGFDVNEQLLGPPRVDLLRDAPDPNPETESAPAPVPAPVSAPAPLPVSAPAPVSVPEPTDTVSVRTSKRALRYVPPPPPPDHAHLHRIIDFIGGAWEDVVRCGAGKVRYFSE